MRGQTVFAPDGSVWQIRRRWAKQPRWRALWRPRRRRSESDGFGWEWIGVVDLVGFWWLLVAVAFIAFMIFVGVPLLIFLAESLLIIPTVVVGLAGRMLFRRPWTIEVLKEGGLGEAIPWDVVGWRASARAIAQIVGNLEAGSPPLVGLRRALPPAPFRRLP